MNKSKIKLVCLIACVAVAVSIFLFSIPQFSKNKAISLAEQVKTSKANITIQEKRRIDSIYNLADCVKSYNKYESETLIDLAEARNSNSNTGSIDVQTSIKAVAESYPELKADNNYKRYMKELTVTENLISDYRKTYNGFVQDYNSYIQKFPTSLFLNISGYVPEKFDLLDYSGSAPEDAPQNLLGD